MVWAELSAIAVSVGMTPQQVAPLTLALVFGYLICSRKLGKLLNPIKFAVVEIQTIHKGYGHQLQYCLTETSHSPLKPTEFGWKLIKESGLDKIIEKDKRSFFVTIKKKLGDDATAYDVQDLSRKIMVESKDNPVMKCVKTYAFKNGIDVNIILRTGGLLLRDEYMKEYNIKGAETVKKGKLSIGGHCLF